MYAWEPQAYAKAVMHACKHSSDLVTGVVIGTVSQKVMNIVDTIPLFHTHSLGPMLKIAFMLIEQHCRTCDDLEIIGLYHATPSGSLDISPVKAIADKLASNFSMASVWTLDLQKLAVPERKFAMAGMLHSKDEWKAINADAVSIGDEALKHTGRMIS